MINADISGLSAPSSTGGVPVMPTDGVVDLRGPAISPTPVGNNYGTGLRAGTPSDVIAREGAVLEDQLDGTPADLFDGAHRDEGLRASPAIMPIEATLDRFSRKFGI